MNEQSLNEKQTSDLPVARVETRSGISIVWLIPLVALLVGAWLAYKAWSETGPTITINFKTAEGLEAGKTKIKYKNVEIGQIRSIELSDDLSHVIVTAELVRNAKHYVTQSTRFWVVRARIAAGEVSGLSTLLSGAYIGIDPGKEGDSARHFVGLETPPVLTDDTPGSHFFLRADNLGSLDVGSPVYYRMIKVGQVIGYRFAEDGQSVEIDVFIHSPHDKQVNSNTRFWNASGLEISLDANGIQINTESLVTVMMGGIAFETPRKLSQVEPVAKDREFVLFKNREATILENPTLKIEYVLHFSGSVRGLSLGAPVEFRGIPVGEVIDIDMEFNAESNEIMIPVTIEFIPESIIFKGVPNQIEFIRSHHKTVMNDFVKRGMRAQLKTGNYMTGQLFIDLDFIPDAPIASINWEKTPPVFPTTPTPFEEISTTLTSLIKKLKNLPLEKIGSQLQDTVITLTSTMQKTEQLVHALNTSVTPAITATLDETQKMLSTVEQTIQSDSSTQRDLQDVFDELSKALRSIRIMADYLERHPEALIHGKREN
ncbi:intermembrane transport protein PqiB [Nitrosomonas sp. Nm33]|uniref:PqiB family protein n=1 Tax=Nitrosomonas sp. Nm33 TaxID=133724 RepID=UPI00089D458B|nr:MlaD family protein [Nitrosomonas sp. Nm33]SDY17599.1 paraquat-inducible protein B [Nitrosomonas sp. Nm33]